MNKKCYNTFLMCTQTVCAIKNPLNIAAQFIAIATEQKGQAKNRRHVFEFENLVQSVLRWRVKTVQEEEEKGSASLCFVKY